jgi:hypothetical protein
MFKQRRLTWVLFPAVTLGVTLFTVWLSQWYMQPSDERRTVEFLDVGDDGGVARRSRFELLFTSTPRQVTTEVKGEVFAAFDHQQYRSQAQMYAQYSGAYGRAVPDQLVGPADYAGRIPAHYTVTQQVPQWTPQINRFFSIPAGGEPPAFDWQSVPPPQSGGFSVGDAAWRSRLLNGVRGHFSAGASVWVFSGQQSQQIAGNYALFQRRAVRHPYDPVFYNEYGPSTADAGDFLHQTCVRPARDLFALVSRVAPAGGDNFEDLPVLDSGDPRQCLVVVAVEEAGHLKIYRKLYVK